jgi:hypothetical protein
MLRYAFEIADKKYVLLEFEYIFKVFVYLKTVFLAGGQVSCANLLVI